MASAYLLCPLRVAQHQIMIQLTIEPRSKRYTVPRINRTLEYPFTDQSESYILRLCTHIIVAYSCMTSLQLKQREQYETTFLETAPVTVQNPELHQSIR